MNYSGDLVCAPADAARMQRGEGLHLMNLTAGNLSTSLVYDRELLEDSPAGPALVGEDMVARTGVEYRNDLLGHVHALGPSAPPTRYYAGHERLTTRRTGRRTRWRARSCGPGCHRRLRPPGVEEFREDGRPGVLPQPAFGRGPGARGGRRARGRRLGRSDLPYDDEAAVYLYHRLLSCGLRLAATAGTDVFLSFSHGPGVASNPPGWGRVYAQLGDQALSVAAFKEAVRGGPDARHQRAVVDVRRYGPGAGRRGRRPRASGSTIRARGRGPGAERLTLVGPDGVVTESDAASESGSRHPETGLPGSRPWRVAARHPNSLDPSGLAHTTPVYVDVAGRRVARAADVKRRLELPRHARAVRGPARPLRSRDPRGALRRPRHGPRRGPLLLSPGGRDPPTGSGN